MLPLEGSNRQARRPKLVCGRCGYGSLPAGSPLDCPACGERVWEPALWRPFSRTGGYERFLLSRTVAAAASPLESRTLSGRAGDWRCRCGHLYRFHVVDGDTRFWSQNGLKSFAREPVGACVRCRVALGPPPTALAA